MYVVWEIRDKMALSKRSIKHRFKDQFMVHQYPANLAELIREKLLKEISDSKPRTQLLALDIPSIEVLTGICEIFYFASFHTEEGRYIQLRVAYADPKNSDPDAPSRVRADRWTFTRLHQTVPFSVEEAVKLAKAADPWSSALAVFSSPTGELYVWGIIDQRVHFNTFLLREGGGGYDPPGVFEVTVTGVADITVYRGGAILGRLSHGALAEPETDVLWVGPVSDRLNESITKLRRRIRKKVGARIYDAG